MLAPREQGDFGERAALCWLVGQGPRCAEFEAAPGQALPARTAEETPSTIAS
jgi:hypothetical protein